MEIKTKKFYKTGEGQIAYVYSIDDVIEYIILGRDYTYACDKSGINSYKLSTFDLLYECDINGKPIISLEVGNIYLTEGAHRIFITSRTDDKYYGVIEGTTTIQTWHKSGCASLKYSCSNFNIKELDNNPSDKHPTQTK